MKFHFINNKFFKTIGICSTLSVINGSKINYNFHCLKDYKSICNDYKFNLNSTANYFEINNFLSRNVTFEIFVDNLMDNDVPQYEYVEILDSNFKNHYSGDKYPNYKEMSKVMKKDESVDIIMVFDNFKNNEDELNNEYFTLYNIIYDQWMDVLHTINAYNKSNDINKLEDMLLSKNSILSKFEIVMPKIGLIKNLYEKAKNFYKINLFTMLYENEQSFYEPKPEPVHWNNTLIIKEDDHKALTGRFDRIIAVGDIHGDYDKLIKVLTAAKLVNKRKNWIAKNTALVQLGDLMDRGNDIKRIFELMIKLKKQATHYDSVVHMIIGNHEAMNIGGRYDYMTLSDVVSFFTIKNREEQLSLKGKFGNLIRKEMDAVKVVGDSLFVHAGLLPYHLNNMTLDDINNHFHEVLMNATTYPSRYTTEEELYSKPVFIDTYFDNEGPIWTRALYEIPEIIICNDLSMTLNMTNTKRMIVGHTIQEDGQIHTKCNNQLYFIDVGMSIAYLNSLAYLEMKDNGEIWAKYD